MRAFFSATDDADERGLALYGVVGRLDTAESEVALRAGAFGHWLPLSWSRVFGGDRGPFRDLVADAANSPGIRSGAAASAIGHHRRSPWPTWLHRLAVNVIIERFRTLGTARERFLADSEAVLEVAHATRTKHLDLSMDLQVAIAQLPHGARTVFVLHDVEGYKHEEIGDILGVSAGTSKSQLHRARQTLRVLLRKEA